MYMVEMTSCGMIYLSSFMKIGTRFCLSKGTYKVCCLDGL
jgi:hypothetical protein